MTDTTPSFNGLVDMSRLTQWMDQSRLGHGPCEDVVRLGGGTQNILLQFRRGDRTYVLRRPPEHPLTDGSRIMMREARLLRALAHTAVPHPALIAECSDQNVIGEAFYLMEAIDGFNVTAGLPAHYRTSPETQRALALSMVDAILALGTVDYIQVGLDGFGKPEGYLERQVPRLQGQLESYADFPGWPGKDSLLDVDVIGAWLQEHRPQSFIPGIVHGDCHLANAMFRSDRPAVAALIDWELATIGDPLLDLGWLVATWPRPDGSDTGSSIAVPGASALPTTEELVAHYAAATPRNMANFPWYAVLACYKLAILQEGSYARACAGKAPMDIGLLQHERAVAMLKRANAFIAAANKRKE